MKTKKPSQADEILEKTFSYLDNVLDEYNAEDPSSQTDRNEQNEDNRTTDKEPVESTSL